MGVREIENKFGLVEGTLIPLTITVIGVAGVLASSIACFIEPTSNAAAATDVVSMLIGGVGLARTICIRRECCLPKSSNTVPNPNTIATIPPSPAASSTVEHIPSPLPSPGSPELPEETPMIPASNQYLVPPPQRFTFKPGAKP